MIFTLTFLLETTNIYLENKYFPFSYLFFICKRIIFFIFIHIVIYIYIFSILSWTLFAKHALYIYVVIYYISTCNIKHTADVPILK